MFLSEWPFLLGSQWKQTSLHNCNRFDFCGCRQYQLLCDKGFSFLRSPNCQGGCPDCIYRNRLLKLYSDFSYEVLDSPNRVILTTAWGDYTTAPAKLKKTQLRQKGGIKSPILADIGKNTEVTVLETGDTWTKVSTAEGIIGYIKSKALGATSTKTLTSDYVAEEFTHIKKDFKINMAWHQITNADANTTIASVLQNTKGINVISPTWFYLNDNNGNIASLASSDYVNYCHQKGIEVWALVSNLENKEMSTPHPF